MRFSRHTIEQRHPVDLAPLVTVVLLLIFFFLLSWSFVLRTGVEVHLPTTSFFQGSPQSRHIITLKKTAKDNTMTLFDEKVVSDRELRACLSGATQGEWITLNADESIPHGRVQQAASMAMEMGFHVNVATQRPPASSAGEGSTAGGATP